MKRTELKRTELKRKTPLRSSAPTKARKPMKSKPIPSSKIRRSARGKPCMIRLPGICDGGGETTVLAHYRMSGYCGTGIKPDDFVFGAYACQKCHDVCDSRARDSHLSHAEIRLYHAEGVMRTQMDLLENGILPEAAHVS